MEPAILAKVAEYEAFLNDRLRRDLTAAQAERQELQAARDEWVALETNIKTIVEGKHRHLRLQVDIGAQVLCQAEVPDTSRIFIDAGLGFHVEATLEEALAMIPRRVKSTQAKIDHASRRIADINARIKFMVQALTDLQNLG